MDEWTKILEEQAPAEGPSRVPIPDNAVLIEEVAEDQHFLTVAEGMKLAREYFECGSIRECARRFKISYPVALRASKEVWFLEEVSALERESKIAQKANMTRLMGRAAEQLEERLEHGDWVVLKTGELVRKPVGSRDLAAISAMLYEKRRDIESDPNLKPSSGTNKLTQIAERLENKIRGSEDGGQA